MVCDERALVAGPPRDADDDVADADTVLSESLLVLLLVFVAFVCRGCSLGLVVAVTAAVVEAGLFDEDDPVLLFEDDEEATEDEEREEVVDAAEEMRLTPEDPGLDEDDDDVVDIVPAAVFVLAEAES